MPISLAIRTRPTLVLAPVVVSELAVAIV